MLEDQEGEPVSRRTILGKAWGWAKGGLAAAAAYQVGAPEVRREYRDRYLSAELKESVERRRTDVYRDFGIRVETDVKDLAVMVFGLREKYQNMNSLSILDDYFALLEEILWTLPPDMLSNFVETIVVARSVGRDASGRAPLLADMAEPHHRRLHLAIDKYLTGIFAIRYSLDGGIFASVNDAYRATVYHEIAHRLTTQTLLSVWPESGDHVSAYGRSNVPVEDIATFAEALFGNRQKKIDPKKMHMLREHVTDMLRLPVDYWQMITTGPHPKEEWKEYWGKHERLRAT